MTRGMVDLLAGKAMILIERLGYPMALAPLVVDRLKTGAWPSGPISWILDAAAGCALLAIALLMGYARRQKERARGLQKTLNEAIIHDLKNPMTAIMACLTYMAEDSPGAERRAKLINLALHSCRSQMTLLEALVDTSRLEHGDLVARKTTMRTRELLDSCLGDVRGVASHLGVNLKTSAAGPIPKEFHGDPDLLPRTISNLLHNAIKYTPPGGDVSLSIRSDGAGLTFEINDTGIGIPMEHIDRLFGKYYRVEGSDQTTRRGSGLGLYFCRLVVEAHGGKISIKSRVGSGTTITFNIPESSNGGGNHDVARGILSCAAERSGSGQPG